VDPAMSRDYTVFLWLLELGALSNAAVFSVR
jgi:hypothetical protein